MKYYVIVTSSENGEIRHFLSSSRDAVMHLVTRKAKSAEVYDRQGWLLCMAERDPDGKPFRPKLFLDGEPKAYYKDLYFELLKKNKKEGENI